MLHCLYRVYQRFMYSAHVIDDMLGKRMLMLNVHTDYYTMLK
jgi:hypothetical protein